MKKLDRDDVQDFVLGGKALFTVKNEETGSRFTYKVQKSKKIEDSPLFVSVLTGANNEVWSNYTFLGTIFDEKNYRHGKNSSIGYDAQSELVFKWFFPRVLAGKLPDVVNVYHEGKCGICGRKLTVPESIELGFGAKCLSMRL